MAENQIQAPPPEGQINGGGSVPENVASKRQRRPSVRLGDIGEQTYDRRSNNNASVKSSKTRPLTNLTPSPDLHQTLDSHSHSNLAWNPKRRAAASTKRLRSNWVPKIDEGGAEEQEPGDDKYSGGGGGGEDLDDFEHSPIHSMENEREVAYMRSIRDRADAGSDSDVRDWNGSIGLGGRGRYGEDGIRIWLNSLGLGRYAPVFEIHEVDDQVLPLLTLEDLKDMGIDAVGSRRKMYCAIQKLGKGFS